MPALDVTIRPATNDDVASILAWMVPFNAHEHIPFSPAKVEPALRALLADAGIGFVRVAVSASQGVVAYVIVTFGFDLEFAGRDAFVTELFVAETHRGSGVARALLDTAERDARANDVRALHLFVRPDNPGAYRLYESIGFERVPRDVLTKKL